MTLQALLASLNGLTEAENMNIGQLILTETFEVRNIKDTHPTISGVRSGSKIPILEASDDYGGFPFTAGDCTLPACTITDDYSVFTWDLGQIGCEVTICMESQGNDFLAFYNTYKKMNEDDIESALIQFIIKRVQERHLKGEIRVAYFGDDASSNPLINGFDGFFVQMEAKATAGVNKIEITQNDATTVAGQTITDGQVIYDYLAQMYALASVQPWFNPAQMVYRLDRADVGLLVGWLNMQSDLKGISCACIDPSKVVNERVFSADNISLFGIPIEAMPFRDAMKAITELYDPSTGLYVGRNRYILARREALVLGYEIEDTLKRFKVGYDERANEIYIQAASLFGAGVPTDSFILAN